MLREIASVITVYLPPHTDITTDLGTYSFPQHIVPTDLRPDVVWWDHAAKKLCLVELTVCFETSFNEAAERKQVKYQDLVERARCSNYRTTLITLEVGSRGMVNMEGFMQLKQELNISKPDITQLLVVVAKTSIMESFKIWCMRNTK